MTNYILTLDLYFLPFLASNFHRIKEIKVLDFIHYLSNKNKSISIIDIINDFQKEGIIELTKSSDGLYVSKTFQPTFKTIWLLYDYHRRNNQ